MPPARLRQGRHTGGGSSPFQEELLEGIIESVDEFYSANLGQDIRRGLRENASRGFYSIGRAPYGFHKVPVRDGAKTRYKLEPEPEDSISVKVSSQITSFVFVYCCHNCPLCS